LEAFAIIDDPKDGWVEEVLKFWFEQTEPDQWFEKDAAFDASIREYFLGLHEIIVSRASNKLLTDPQTALAAVIVLDQMSRNIFRDTPRAFAADPQALELAEAAIARGFDAGVTNDQRIFSVPALPACRGSRGASPLGRTDGESGRSGIGKVGGSMWRISTPDEIGFLKHPDSYF